jgi:hypothetical protein
VTGPRRTVAWVVVAVGLVVGCGEDERPSATPSTTVATSTTTTSAAPTPATTATTSPTTTTATTTSPPAPARIETVTADDLYASWRPGCPVGPEELRRITVTHLGFDGAEHTGTLIVHADWAEALLGVFDQLRAAGFPIERMEPVDAFGGSDDASMAVNNTSAFNCRPVTNGTSWSRHSYGTAVDVNPRQNPYVLGSQVLPPEGRDHLDRSPAPGRILDGDAVVEAFAAIGWRWGGHWADPVDYQHFDTG